MSDSNLNSFMQNIRRGDMSEAKDVVETALYAKLDSALNEKRKQVAQSMFQVSNQEVVSEEVEGEDEENFT